MEQKFIAAFEVNRAKAEELGARMRPVDAAAHIKAALLNNGPIILEG